MKRMYCIIVRTVFRQYCKLPVI